MVSDTFFKKLDVKTHSAKKVTKVTRGDHETEGRHTRRYFLGRFPRRTKEKRHSVSLNKHAIQKENQKRIFSNLYDLLAEDPVIRVDEFRGKFILDCRSELFKRLILHKQYEPKLVQYCIDLLDKNRDAIDVGANIGFYTVLLAKSIVNGKVLSIEPTKNALSRLYKNIQLNCVEDNVVVFEGVVSNHVGVVEIKTIDGMEEFSSLGEMKHPVISASKFVLEEVVSTTIDELTSRYGLNPGFLKLDVEGLEHLVLDGSKNVLETNRPIILSELSNFLLKANGSSSADVIKLMKAYDYDVIDPIDPILPPGNKNFGDILCLPK